MKKRVVIVLIIVILVLIGFLYQTFAMSNTITEENDTYVVNVSDNTSIELPARTSKKVYYKLTNTNNGVVRYGIGYSGTNVEAKVYEDSVDSETGLIDYMENKFIKLKLINKGTTSSTITLSTVLGYENGGDLIVPSGVTLVKNKVKLVNFMKLTETNPSATSNFLNTTLTRNTIETLTITDDNLVSTDALGSFDVSRNNDGTVMLWYTKGTSDNLYNVYIGAEGGKVYITNCYYLFSYLTSVTKMDFTYFDTSESTWMESMFKYCTSVKKLDLSMFDTSKVTYMSSMFDHCDALTSLNVSGFNTSKVTNMTSMFNNCQSLESIDLSNFDTSNVTSMRTMFLRNYTLKELNLSKFNTSKVTFMNAMFQYCTSLTKLNISSFDTSNVTNMSAIFSYDSKLTLIDMRNMTFTSKLTDANSMFYSASNNATIYVKSNIEKAWLNAKYSSLTNVIVISNY